MIEVPKLMSKPAERYMSLQGKFVYLPEGNFYGEIREVDFDNGILVLDNSPAFDTVQRKIVLRKDIFVPFFNHPIVQITKPELEHMVTRMEHDLANIDKYVTIGAHHGKLVDMGWHACALNPALVNIVGKYRWEEERTINVPRDHQSVIIPSTKEELDELVHQSETAYKLGILEKQRRLKELQKEQS